MILTAPLAVTAGTVSILSDELKWQMVFISSAPACSNYHYQMMQTYYDLTIHYVLPKKNIIQSMKALMI